MIRKILLLLLLFLCGPSSQAQDLQGKTMLNTGLNFSSHNENSTNDSLYDKRDEMGGSIYLNIGRCITNRFAVGFAGAYTQRRLISTEFDISEGYFTEKILSSFFSAGAFARYNVMLKDEKLGFFFQLKSTFNFGYEQYFATQKSPPYAFRQTGTDKLYGISNSLTPGIIYFITNKFSLEASIGDVSHVYTVTKSDNTSYKTSVSDFGLNFSLRAITIGFSYYFGGKKTEHTSISN